jgi:arylsulfatase A-like enzyme
MFAGTASEGVHELHREGEYSTDIFADAACEFIDRHSNSGNPWFCYLPFNAPHFPTAGNKRPGQPNEWQAPDWAFEACGLKPTETVPSERYRAVVYALDAAIGRVMKRLDTLQIAERTFVFFMSDNGSFMLGREGLDVGSNLPLRSGGVTCWEGGLRVPAMARWPGKIPAASTVDQPLWSPDLLPACLQLAGTSLPSTINLDGRNPLPALTIGAPSPHQSLFFEYESHAALRSGDWKIVRESPQADWKLFHISSDISESHDLAQQHPERVQKLVAEWLAWQKSF